MADRTHDAPGRSPGAGANRSPTRVVGVTPGTALLVVVAVFAAFLLRNAFVAAHRTFGWLIACSVVALLIDPIVSALQRKLPRWASIVTVLLGVVAVFVGVAVALTNQLLDSIGDLERAAPNAARGLEDRFDWAADVGVAERVESLIRDLHRAVRDVTIDRAVDIVPTYLVTGILMLFLLGWGRRYLAGMLDQFDDEARRERWRKVIGRSVRRGRTYLLCTLAHSVVNGVVFGLVCWLLDLPAPFALGVAVAAMTVFPIIGVVVGGVPALLLAFGAQSWGVGFVTLAVIVALQLAETLIVRPLVDARTLRLGPTVPIVVGLLAYELYGIGGTIYGIAMAVLALAALDAIGWVQGDDPHPENLKESGIATDDLPEPA